MDAKDRRALAICVILLVMATAAVLWSAAVLAAAMRLFEIIS